MKSLGDVAWTVLPKHRQGFTLSKLHCKSSCAQCWQCGRSWPLIGSSVYQPWLGRQPLFTVRCLSLVTVEEETATTEDEKVWRFHHLNSSLISLMVSVDVKHHVYSFITSVGASAMNVGPLYLSYKNRDKRWHDSKPPLDCWDYWCAVLAIKNNSGTRSKHKKVQTNALF